MIKEIKKIVSCFVSGMSDYRSLCCDSLSVSRHAEEALNIISTLHFEHFFTITLNDDDSFLVNGVRMLTDTPEAKQFFVKLRQKGVATIVVSKGVRAVEIQKLLADLATSGSIFHAYAHIAVKRCEQQPRMEASPTKQGLKHKLMQIKKIYHDISANGRLDMANVDSVVGGLVASVRKEDKLSALMKEDSDDLYVHSAKVAVFSIFQGEYLGLGDALLYDIGLAALLHDVGKVLLPDALLEKHDPLSETEWTVMKNHPAQGAALLASLNKVPEVAIIVAYEHHRRYDGTGYPQGGRTGKQHIISQLVAIADFYCAMSTGLSYRKPLNGNCIMRLLAESAGREFNPRLVYDFIRAIRTSSLHIA